MPSRPSDHCPPRAIQYLADYEGCGHWRMIWPEMVLNAHHKAVVHSTNVMCGDPRYYAGVTAVRLQRQGTANQLAFVRSLRGLATEIGFRLIYEVDDVMLGEDIPAYNAQYKRVLSAPEIRRCIPEIIRECDEVTVPSAFLRDYVRDRVGHERITILPNFAPRFWIGGFHDPVRIASNYDTHAPRPRILYAGSVSHVDAENATAQQDDFAHVLAAMAESRHRFRWVFLGALPAAFRRFVEDGSVEFHPWRRLYEYPAALHELRVNALVAPLQDNVFNRAKSDLKYLEACALGLPIACQNLPPYEQAPLRFDSADELIDLLDDVLADKHRYMEHVHRARQAAEPAWLENDANLDAFVELISLPHGHPDRRILNRLNGLRTP